MCKMKELVALLLVAVQIQNVKPVIHTLKYIRTASSQIPNFPEYLSVGYVDGVQITHYDSKSGKYRPKQDWMNKITAEDPSYWETQTHIIIGNQQATKVSIENLQKRFNQTGGVHMFQVMYGCEWDDETGEVDGWQHFAYDGEDFISFDLKGLRWIAVKPQAVVTKHKWEQFNLQYKKHYFTEECPAYLKKYVRNGRDFLMRTELPRISLLQKTSRSPVTCHATGFHPREADLFWKKDGKQLFEDVEMGETLPNHDGTFQTTADLIVVDANAKYECVFQLAGVPEDVVVPLDHAKILSNERIEAEERRKTALAVGIPLAFLALSLTIVVVVIAVKCRKPKYIQAAVCSDSEPSSPVRALELASPTSETTLAEPAPG
ncbi:major histocompatibility complex class I-related gene protein-like isoform X2 [Corythoichthys intestinalis]|uniref:major histocompatibility complex class I-related gene protein-like isoform X1 n=1 Tax=Corythoichthys intestinalis TaxID=161448 RepID=UPI0025A562D9|nr:major histocompatibility complex class I-related gene protein-like isoform X1 [Corythoichthys intestinalis]XP_057683543.1 major histocompatibility complex class I-related gene protein-like isoform X2 [Corythoichthys intestinalis]XP_061808374.1 major histocompatibility complex class I-related gene protein-like [Nerophis lumbriciformis]